VRKLQVELRTEDAELDRAKKGGSHSHYTSGCQFFSSNRKHNFHTSDVLY
jgi:hypothetical protein